MVQKYWRPEFGKADANSDTEIPTQVEIWVMRMIPQTMRTGPPELIPVTSAAEMPNQELVREKPRPRTDHTEKLRFMS